MKYFSLLIVWFAISCHRPAKPHPPFTGQKTNIPQQEIQTIPFSKKEAIKKGIDFLQQSHWEFDFVYLYSYLQPKFGWPNLPAQAENSRIADSLQKSGTTQALTILHQMKMFERLRNPNYVLPLSEMIGAQEEDAFTVPALYCDHSPIDTSTFFPVLRNEIAAGGYRLSHALLALLWLEEKKCLPPDQLSNIRSSLIQGNKEIVSRSPSWMDLPMEAAALLAATGEPIPEKWINEIIAAQQKDGGWIDIPQHSQSNTHTTLLALWILALAQ